MSDHHKKDDWLRDIKERQRNVVFPDTAQNEARFWRNLYEGKQRLSNLQKAGVTVMFAAALLLGVVVTLSAFESSRGVHYSWYHSLFVGGIDWVIAFVLLGCFLLLLRWKEGKRTGGK